MCTAQCVQLRGNKALKRLHCERQTKEIQCTAHLSICTVHFLQVNSVIFSFSSVYQQRNKRLFSYLSKRITVMLPRGITPRWFFQTVRLMHRGVKASLRTGLVLCQASSSSLATSCVRIGRCLKRITNPQRRLGIR